jgi:homocysteine S-methyltransferase
VAGLHIPVIAGVWAFDSALNAEFMANEVPDVAVPDALVQRMRGTHGAEQAAGEGVAIARELVAALRGMTAGVVVSTPGGRADRALEVLRGGATTAI